MKRAIAYSTNGKINRKKIIHIPLRYIIALLISVIEIMAILGIVVAFCYRLHWFAVVAGIAHFACVLKIIASDDNPDYKVPWLLLVLTLPVVGFMLYFLFYSRKLDKKFIKRIKDVQRYKYSIDDSAVMEELNGVDGRAGSQAMIIRKIAYTNIFRSKEERYYSRGEDMWRDMLDDIRRAESFIFLEYFIIEDGIFWESILDVLKNKVKDGVLVKVIYDDIGCMATLPGNYYRKLNNLGIDAVPFSILRGQANNEFNNRSHRKILVIDGKVAYTGGINIADEYVNEKVKFGHWKDTGIRIAGMAVWELTWLFVSHLGINVRTIKDMPKELYPISDTDHASGFVIPFGDGPKPIYRYNVAKNIIKNMLDTAVNYMYMTTPYLIIDNELCAAIEGAAMRGVDVRIIVPHIPDKRIIFGATRSYYHRLMESGVKIYEYTPGFIHAKSYVCDGKYAMIGTVNLDYRSLVHHFENGVWMYGCEVIRDIEDDIRETIGKSIKIEPEMLKTWIIRRFIRSVVRVFAPLL